MRTLITKVVTITLFIKATLRHLYIRRESGYQSLHDLIFG